MRYALYLDWENLWITHIKVCFPRLHVTDANLPRPIASHQERNLLAELPDLMMRVLRDRMGSVPRFSKAFAVWESLNYCDDMPSRLRQGNIVPIQSLGKIYHKSGRRNVKESSDRALIIKVIEDVMLRPHARPQAVVVGTGDFGFVPLIEFLMEHTDIEVYILSYRACLSQPLEQMIKSAFDDEHVIVIDDDAGFESFHASCRAQWPPDRPVGIHGDRPPGDRSSDPGTICTEGGGPSTDATIDVAADSMFLYDLARALIRARMPYVDPGLIENRWCGMWEQNKTYSAPAALLFRRAVEESIVLVENHEFDGRPVRTVVLNRDHPALVEPLRKIEEEALLCAQASADGESDCDRQDDGPEPGSQGETGGEIHDGVEEPPRDREAGGNHKAMSDADHSESVGGHQTDALAEP